MANVMYLRGMEASDQQKVDLISEISNLIDEKKRDTNSNGNGNELTESLQEKLLVFF